MYELNTVESEKKHDLGLRYLVNPKAIDPEEQGTAIDQLRQMLPTRDVVRYGHWTKLFEMFDQKIDGLLMTGSKEDSADEFSDGLIKNVVREVNSFIREEEGTTSTFSVDKYLNRTGLKLGIDGHNIMHTFALVRVWYYLRLQHKSHTRAFMDLMDTERNNRLSYFKSRVNDDPVEYSKIEGANWIEQMVVKVGKQRRAEAIEMINERGQERDLQEKFTCQKMQERLDMRYLFNFRELAARESARYVVNENAVLRSEVSFEMERDFKSQRDLKKEEAMNYARELLTELQMALYSLNEQLVQEGLTKDRAEDMLKTSETKQVDAEMEKQKYRQTMFETLVQSLKNGVDLPLDGDGNKKWKCPRELGLVKNFSAGMTVLAAPMLGEFVKAAIQRVGELQKDIRKHELFVWKDTEMGISTTQPLVQGFLNAALGCQKHCPLCKRKCSRETHSDGKHECAQGHQLMSMGGVVISTTNEKRNKLPYTRMCHEMKPEQHMTLPDGTRELWEKIIVEVSPYNEWDWESGADQDNMKRQERLEHVWDSGLGQVLVTEHYSNRMRYACANDSRPAHDPALAEDPAPAAEAAPLL